MRFCSILLAIVLPILAFGQTANSLWKQELDQPIPGLYVLDELYRQCEDTICLRALRSKLNRELESSSEKHLNTFAYAKAISKFGEHQQASRLLSELYPALRHFSDALKGEYFGALGSIGYNSEAPGKAKAYLQKSIAYLEKGNNPVTLQAKFISLGMVCSALGEYEEALDNYLIAETFSATSTPRQTLYLRLNRALTYSEMGQLEEAKIAFKHALKSFQKAPDHYAEIRTIGNIGDIYLQQDSLKQALSYFKLGLDWSYQENHRMAKVRFHLSLSEVWERLKNFEKAHYHLQKHHEIRTQLHLQETNAILSNLEMQHKVEQEKSRKQAQAQMYSQEVERSTLLWISTIIFLLLSLILSVLLVLIRRKKRVLLKKNMAETLQQSTRTIVQEHAPLLQKLEEYVVERQHFKESQLTLEKLAKKLHTNRSYLSEAINNNYGMNFSKWINEVRIQQSRRLLVSPDYMHYSIEGISSMVGFHSVSSFNANFKSITGLTPSYFRKHGLSH